MRPLPIAAGFRPGQQKEERSTHVATHVVKSDMVRHDDRRVCRKADVGVVAARRPQTNELLAQETATVHPLPLLGRVAAPPGEATVYAPVRRRLVVYHHDAEEHIVPAESDLGICGQRRRRLE